MRSEKITEKPYFAFMLAIIGVIFFSSKAVIIKIAYQYPVDAVSLLFLRLLFALPVYIIIIFIAISKSGYNHINKIEFGKLIFLGFIGYYLASYLDFLGLKYISASLERIVLFAYPTLVLILSAIFLKKKVTGIQKLAVGITYAGLILAFYQNAYAGGDNLILGAVLVFISAFCYAIYLIGSGNLIPKFGTWLFTSIAMTVATICSIIHFTSKYGTDLFQFPTEVYLLALIMSVISTLIPSFLISEAIRIIGSSNVAIIGSFGPVSTIILAVIFLGETLSKFQISGTIVVIFGVLFLTLWSKVRNTNSD